MVRLNPMLSMLLITKTSTDNIARVSRISLMFISPHFVW
jgi:hypothetical protein